MGRIVSASGQIFRSDFSPQDEIFRPGMPFRPSDEQALCDKMCISEETYFSHQMAFNGVPEVSWQVEASGRGTGQAVSMPRGTRLCFCLELWLLKPGKIVRN